MRFNRNLKHQIPRSYPSGYQAPSTLLFNTDQAQFLIGDSEPQAVQTLNESWPEQIELMVDFDPVFIKNTAINVQITDMMPIQLYQDRQPTLERLEFKVRGTPKLTEYAFDPTGTWSLSFGYQDRSFTYDPIQGQQDVWDYGGFYEQGCDLQLIQPQFFSLIVSGDQTEIKTSSLAMWHSHGITPPSTTERDDRLIIFHGQGPYTDLQSFLERGGLKFNLTYEGELMQSYVSSSVRRLQEQLLSITFVKEEDKGEKEA